MLHFLDSALQNGKSVLFLKTVKLAPICPIVSVGRQKRTPLPLKRAYCHGVRDDLQKVDQIGHVGTILFLTSVKATGIISVSFTDRYYS